jgi:hypothetical protein
MSHQDALNTLTEGFKPVAQMKIALAEQLGFIADPDYILIAPHGDDSSAGLPFIIEPTRNDSAQYEFLTYDAKDLTLVSPEYQVLVYQEAPPPPLTDDQQIDILRELAEQFPQDSLIAQFLNPNMFEWLIIHHDRPDIWHSWYYMNITSARLEGHIDDLDDLF